MADNNTAMTILVNLAKRARATRKDLRRVREQQLGVRMHDYAAGAEREAWNSFQAAKQLFNEARGISSPRAMKK